MKTEDTLFMIKPDGFVNAEFITKMIQKGCFEIVSQKTMTLSEELIRELYREHAQKSWFPEHEAYMKSGRVILLHLRKVNAIEDLRKLNGNTDPKKAEIGTIRYYCGTSVASNASHSSASSEDAPRELKLFFPENFCTTNIAA